MMHGYVKSQHFAKDQYFSRGRILVKRSGALPGMLAAGSRFGRAASFQLAEALASDGDRAARRSEQAADDEPGRDPDMLGNEP